jgi:transcriptional regulator with XRE-family HTH domain
VDPEAVRRFLQGELVRRCQSNPRYSMRAFARALDLEPSALSKLLAGKRRVTPEMFERLAKRLAIGPEELRGLLGPGGAALPASKKVFDQVSLDAFQVISDWYHLAILELVRVDRFRGDPAAIAKALGISLAETRQAIERLTRLGVLAVTAEGTVVSTAKELTTVGLPFTSAALKSMQRQVLELAIKALDETPMERRDQSTMTMAINAGRLGEARAKIREFRRGLCTFLEEEPPRTEVYHLSISLYPVTNLGG